jgi:hypothetical protein
MYTRNMYDQIGMIAENTPTQIQWLNQYQLLNRNFSLKGIYPKKRRKPGKTFLTHGNLKKVKQLTILLLQG